MELISHVAQKKPEIGGKSLFCDSNILYAPTACPIQDWGDPGDHTGRPRAGNTLGENPEIYLACYISSGSYRRMSEHSIMNMMFHFRYSKINKDEHTLLCL